jgi:hypothetical protein
MSDGGSIYSRCRRLVRYLNSSMKGLSSTKFFHASHRYPLLRLAASPCCRLPGANFEPLTPNSRRQLSFTSFSRLLKPPRIVHALVSTMVLSETSGLHRLRPMALSGHTRGHTVTGGLWRFSPDALSDTIQLDTLPRTLIISDVNKDHAGIAVTTSPRVTPRFGRCPL